ncbi:hypothetical protein P154DRAFT_436780 [Amniculicola lignicola CBS 123094]|uniref:Uncharacterized protein n=1 Tax=Amniculicola lignicola CBS 123094 TaxID=1392246 RepID=A0A6A5WCL2_9PLEO|nr:hypothetical protein P154DRAFT_436780 [Amniculicola lignicola CBS 123094]
MLAFQTTKRLRDDDSDSEDDRYLKHARQIRQPHLQSPSRLPLRPSLTPSPPRMFTNIEAMTPAQSEHGDADSPDSVQSEPFILSSPTHTMDVDMDMDEEDLDIIGSPPPESPFIPASFLRPAKLNSTLFSRDNPANNTGRIPTPIYGSFYAPRGPMGGGGMAGLGYPSGGMAGGFSMDNNHLSVPTDPILQPPVMRKQIQLNQDHDRSRRMPSPISEDEDLPDTPTAFTQSQLERLSVTSHNHVSEHNMDLSEEPPPGVNTSPTRGRKRSGAFTGKGRFSMGYREDCDKCRARIPGHYSHFLP